MSKLNRSALSHMQNDCLFSLGEKTGMPVALFMNRAENSTVHLLFYYSFFFSLKGIHIKYKATFGV